MKTRSQRSVLERMGSTRGRGSIISSRMSVDERLNAVRNEISAEILRQRLLNFIVYEKELEAEAKIILEGQKKQLVGAAGSDNVEVVSRVVKEEPVPAFPPVEASVDLSWYQHENMNDEEMLEAPVASVESGVQLILTPLVLSESKFDCETPKRDKSGWEVRSSAVANESLLAVVRSKCEKQAGCSEIVFIDTDDDDDDVLSYELLSSDSESESEYGATP